MNNQNDEKRLDELLAKNINTTKPKFDAEKWKQKYPDEYQSLISRGNNNVSIHLPDIWRIIFRRPFIKFATAAVIILAVGLLLSRNGRTPSDSVTGHRPIASSPVNKMSLMSMKMAYQKGGLDELDRQFRDTLNMTGQHSLSISMQELLEGANGS